jgi:Domain of unknown function (DUF4184)
MPWTFAHPAAVLPLRRCCPRWLHFPALVIGSLTPDLGYYVRGLDLSRLAHLFPDGLPVCVLSGLVLLAAFYLLRRPVCHLLPQPHRGAWLALIAAERAPSLALFASMAVSLALGAVTHMAWDGLTHQGGWAVTQVLALQGPLFSLWGTGIPAYQVLQHLSTLIGTAALLWAYVRWLRREQPYLPLRAIAMNVAREERWRYAWLAAIAIAATICAMLAAMQAATRLPGRFLLDVFVFRAAVDFAVAFGLMFAMSAVLYGWRCRRVR